VPLLESCAGVDRLLARGSPLPELDVQAPLLGLPRIFGTSLTTIPAEGPYLSARTELVERWAKELASVGGLRVGIAWHGHPRGTRQRYVPLRQFAPLARIEGVRLVSLQKGPGTDQLPAFAAEFPITDLGTDLDTTSGAFVDTAAVLKNLDLVIAADVSVAHLAGALAVPVWVALPSVPDWRWLLGREDSPWYPTMRLFRQEQRGNWEPVFARLANELQCLIASS
jgi:hypothetical protein